MQFKTSDYKRKVMMRLATDPEIFRLIDNKTIDPDAPDDLIYRNIFPYLKVDHTIQENGTFIGVRLDYPEINNNEIWKDAYLTVDIICAKGAMKADGGNARTDLLSERINELLCWNGDWGFRLELYSEGEKPIDENFYHRTMTYTFFAANGVECGVKYNRR